MNPVHLLLIQNQALQKRNELLEQLLESGERNSSSVRNPHPPLEVMALRYITFHHFRYSQWVPLQTLLEKNISHVQSDPELSFIHVQCLLNLRNHNGAHAHLQTMLQQDPMNIAARRLLFDFYCQVGQYEDALKEGNIILQLLKKSKVHGIQSDPMLLYTIARIHLAVDNVPLARQTIEEGLVLFPTDPYMLELQRNLNSPLLSPVRDPLLCEIHKNI